MPYWSPYKWPVRVVVVRMITAIPVSSIYIGWPGVWPVSVSAHYCISVVIDLYIFRIVNIDIYITPAFIDIDIVIVEIPVIVLVSFEPAIVITTVTNVGC